MSASPVGHPLSLLDSTSEGTIHLSPVAVSLSAIVLLVNGIISLRFKLGLHTQLVVASIRMVVQLSLLGYVLVPIFTYDKWWLVLMYGVFMLMIASFEAVQRPSYTFQGALANTVLALAASSGLLLTYLVLVVLGLRPLWEAQYIIPLLGMLLGNATSAVSVGLSAVLEDLEANRAVIEHLLALGANRFEATDDAVRRALKVSMTPLLNQMSVMGVVSIPGMMTGQILAGGNPTQAARYQMVIMFVVVAATSIASVASIYLAVLHVVDSTHTYQAYRLLKKQLPNSAGVAGRWAALRMAARRGGAAAARKCAALGSCLAVACCCCLCPAPAPRRRRARGVDGAEGTAAALLSGSGGDRAATAAAAAAEAPDAYPFAAESRRGPSRQPSWLRVSARGGGGGSAPGAKADRLFSAESASSTWDSGSATAGDSLLGNGGGGVTSPVSAGSSAVPTSTPKLSSDDRLQQEAEGGGGRSGGGVYDTEEGGGGPATGPGDVNAAQEHQPLLGPAEAVSEATRPSSMLGSSVSTVVAVGGWLGSQASAGWRLTWNAVGRWPSSGVAAPGGTGQESGTRKDGSKPA